MRSAGSDIVMIFDECTPCPADWDYAKRSMEMSALGEAQPRPFR